MVNYLAVLVAAVASYTLGALWYSPFLFGKLWMSLSGFSEDKLNQMKEKTNLKQSYALGFISTLLSAMVLAYFMDLTGLFGLGSGILLGVLAWLGFTATTEVGGVLWEQKSWKWFLLQTGHSLAGLVVMGLVLGAWK